ncbi:hypothetical protein [Streptomyces antimicrobicus]|uniref:Lipoprotein n=1 Tax=Streptomyces antimicrobicus TaxID=2883108 RepID=A0ABS8BEV4_9ACTN|nr:hypothetical protein [Streptomyces antimicrobicus]MCB5183031.1 hypothetical protein [Streptomyces antimicrobicus]
MGAARLPRRTAPWASAGVAAVAVVAVVSCGRSAAPGPAGGAAGQPRPTPSAAAQWPCAPRTETGPITVRFPEFGPLAATTWCGTTPPSGSRPSVPGPTDVRLFGVLTPGDAARVRAYLDDPSYAFAPSAPERVPQELRGSLPQDAVWVSSRKLDRQITGGRYGGRFHLDRTSGQVVFDCLDPVAKDGAVAQTPPN